MSGKRRAMMAIGLIGALIISAGLLSALGDRNARQGGPASAQEPSNERLITTRGEGRVMVMPDTAEVSLGVQIREEDLNAAQAEATERMDAVLQSLRDNGIEEENIQTVNYSVSVERDWNREDQPIIGYTVMHIVQAKVTEMDRVGEVIDDAVAAGANAVNNVFFTVEDVDAAVRQARERAMEDARERAEHLAELGGVNLGVPMAISEGAATPPSPMPMAREEAMAADSAGGTSIEPGQSEVFVSVTVSYAIN